MAQVAVDMIKQEPIDRTDDDSIIDSSVPLPLSAEHSSEPTTFENMPGKFYQDQLSMPELSLMEPLCNLESSPNKKASPRNVLTLQEKVEVIKFSESTGKSQRQLAAEFKISKTQVMEILRNKETIRMALDENILNPDRKRLYIKKNRHKFPHLMNADKESSKDASNKPAYTSQGNTSVFPTHDFNDLSLCYGNATRTEPNSNTETLEEDIKPSMQETGEEIGKIISAVSLAVSKNMSGENVVLKSEFNNSPEISTLKPEPLNLAEENSIKDGFELEENAKVEQNLTKPSVIQPGFANLSQSQIDPQSSKIKTNKQASITGKSKPQKKAGITIEDKIRLIMTCQKKSQIQIAKEFGITQKDVFEILRDRDEIEEQYRLKRKCLSQSILQDIAFGASFVPNSMDSPPVDNINKDVPALDIIESSSEAPKEPEIRSETSDSNLSHACTVQGKTISDDSSQLQEYLDQNWSNVEESEAASAKGKRKRSSISIEEKMLILQHKGGRSLRETAEAFGIGKTTVLDIFKRSEEITKAFYDDTMNPQRKKMRTWKSTELNYAKVDQAVYLWYRSMVEKGIFLSGPKVQKQAAALAQKLGMTKFKASNGWLAGFCKRHRVSFSNRRKPKAPEGEESSSLLAMPSESDTHLHNLEEFSFGKSNEELSNDTELSGSKLGELPAESSFNHEDRNRLSDQIDTNASNGLHEQANGNGPYERSNGSNDPDEQQSKGQDELAGRVKRSGHTDLLKVFIKTEPAEQDDHHDSDYEQEGESSDDSIPDEEDCA